jgi:hypothetical protein
VVDLAATGEVVSQQCHHWRASSSLKDQMERGD